MTTTTIAVEDIPAIRRREATDLAVEEYGRAADLLAALEPDDWGRPTDCAEWDVRAMASHVLGGTEAFASTREFLHQMRAAAAAAKQGEVFVDAMTARQVEERADLSTDDVVARLREAGPRAARWRARFPIRFAPMKEEVGGVPETWRMGYLLDVILNRDVWMHRVDISRAVGREMVLTPEHDGRIVAHVVAEWARRHGRPFRLRLEGPAGGTYTVGAGGEDLGLDAVEFCRILAGRAPGDGLLAVEVPF